MCGYNFSENALVQGFSPHGGKSATVLERMFQYYGIVSPDVAHVYNQGTDAMSALRYHQPLVPFDSCVRATAAATQGKGMTMQQIIDGDVEKDNVEAPQTVIIGEPPPTLVFTRSLQKTKELGPRNVDHMYIYDADYENDLKENSPYRIQEAQAPIYIRCDDDRVALYEPVAITSSVQFKKSDGSSEGHVISFVSEADKEEKHQWKFINDDFVADFPQPINASKRDVFNREKVLSDFASQLCYRLVKTMSKEEAARRQSAATTT